MLILFSGEGVGKSSSMGLAGNYVKCHVTSLEMCTKKWEGRIMTGNMYESDRWLSVGSSGD